MNNKEIIKNRELLLKNIGQLMDYGPNISLKESSNWKYYAIGNVYTKDVFLVNNLSFKNNEEENSKYKLTVFFNPGSSCLADCYAISPSGKLIGTYFETRYSDNQ